MSASDYIAPLSYKLQAASYKLVVPSFNVSGYRLETVSLKVPVQVNAKAHAASSLELAAFFKLNPANLL
jgi:hypothetical protein